jgi:predicted methyltransferase
MRQAERPRVALTAAAQSTVAEVVAPGMRVVDATVGNGHDTLFLARKVSPGGQVIGFDVQQAAIDATRRRLDAAGLGAAVELRLAGHQHLADVLPTQWHGSVAAVMFNLGYLPGGDKRLVTQPDTTRRALDGASRVLGPTGLLSVIVYPSHAGGDAEAEAVAQWMSGRPAGWSVQERTSSGPVLYLVRRPAWPAA